MTYQEIYNALKTTKLPVTFQFWKSPDDVPPLPYIVFDYPEHNDFAADNVNYVSIVTLQIGLYTPRKSVATEATVEAVLTQYFGKFSKTSDFVAVDAMQETLYTCEVIVNG